MNVSSDLQTEKWAAIYNREVRNYINLKLKPFELQENNFYYILIIIENPGVSQKVLSEYMRREQSIVTKAIRPLIQHGWLELVKDPADKRQTMIYPTEKSLSAYPALKETLGLINTNITSGLTKVESEEFNRLIQKATEHLLKTNKHK